MWNKAVARRQAFAAERRVRRHDGAYHTFSVRAAPATAPAGAPREWVGVHEDITERREFKTALKAGRDAAQHANHAGSRPRPWPAISPFGSRNPRFDQRGTGAGRRARDGVYRTRNEQRSSREAVTLGPLRPERHGAMDRDR